MSQKTDDYAAELDTLTPALMERAEGRCELRIPGVCGKGMAAFLPLNRHHRKPRGQGGENSLSNVLILCGSGTCGCHGYVEHNRTEAYEKGWLIRMGNQDPADVPVELP